MNGSWGDWSEWSSCQADCTKSRNRTCTDPTPMFGGTNCNRHNFDFQDLSCYGDDCCPGEKYILNILAQTFFINHIVDTTNYVGCYHRNDSGLIHKTIDSNDSSPCWCIGYCASHNYSLAGIKKYGLQKSVLKPKILHLLKYIVLLWP